MSQDVRTSYVACSRCLVHCQNWGRIGAFRGQFAYADRRHCGIRAECILRTFGLICRRSQWLFLWMSRVTYLSSESSSGSFLAPLSDLRSDNNEVGTYHFLFYCHLFFVYMLFLTIIYLIIYQFYITDAYLFRINDRYISLIIGIPYGLFIILPFVSSIKFNNLVSV